MSDPIRDALRVAAVYRVQDKDGRGPFKPGMPDRWRDLHGKDFPPIHVEFGLSWRDEIQHGWHCGCALRDLAHVAEWFSATECDRLATLGYRLVLLAECHVLRESRHQLLVARKTAFRRRAGIMPWPHREPGVLDPWRIAAALATETRDE